MRKGIILATVTSAVLAGGVAAWAQPAPPPMADGVQRPDGPMHGGPMGRMQEMMHHGGWMRRMRQFALIYPARDRALSGADVQKIAEAFLLFNGNHIWKITEVSEEPNRVLFAIAMPDGTAIAHFAMDRHTARPERLS